MKDDQSQKPVKLKCEGCGVEAEFNSADEAFLAGWDCPPIFTGVVTCPKCPSAPILFHLARRKPRMKGRGKQTE